jgi:hypothetical protein
MIQTKLSRRPFLVALAALPAAGCYGSFGLTKSLYRWNGSVSNKIVRELVFLVFVIIPVYGIALFIDAVLLNLIEFITGTPVVASHDLGNGRRMALEKLPDQRTTRVVLTENDRVLKVFHVRRDGEGAFTLADETLRPLASSEPTAAGDLLLLDGRGAIVSKIPPETLSEIEHSVADRPLATLVTEALAEPALNRQVAGLRAGSRF